MVEDIKKTLWATVGKLRANMDAAEYKHLHKPDNQFTPVTLRT